MNFITPAATADLEAVKRLNCDERKNLKAQINATDPALIFQAVGDVRNPDKCKIICPICGNGTGEDATPVEVTRKDNTWLYHCFKCDEFKGDLLKIIARDLGVDLNQQDGMIRTLAAGANLINYALERKTEAIIAPAAQIRHSADKKTDADELQLIRADIADAQAHLDELPESQRRGLTLDTLRHFGFGYLPTWTHPKWRLKENSIKPSRRLIIPAGNHYHAVALPADRDASDARKKKYWKIRAGKMETVFNSAALNADFILVVEGEIDAASIWQAFKGKIAVCAVLGQANWRKTLLPRLKTCAEGTKFLILFDAEKDTRKSAENLRGELVKRGLPATAKFIYDFLSDDERDKLCGIKVDANELLIKRGEPFLKQLIEKILDKVDLEAIEKEIANRADFDEVDDTNPTGKFLDGLMKDLDMARRLADFTDHRLKYITDADDWLTYAQAGVWQRQPNHSCVLPFAAKFADFMTDAAKTFPKEAPERKKAFAVGYYFREKKKVAAAVTLLKACESIFVTTDDLDRHPELLNCLNGVVNLQDGKLYPADPKLLLTQQCRADFQPNDQSALVEKFFKAIQPDEETRAGLLRWLGYCLTGETSAEKFAIWTGCSGANGKGTLSGTLLELLGTYATGLAPRALLKSNRFTDANNATTALNALENARFAISEEMPLDGELDTSLVKNLTGGDRINLRRNYGEYRTIRATAKINLSGNFAPKIENVHDGGILRRLINFSFNVQFGTDEHHADPLLKKKLILPENLRGLLSLLVREAEAWYRVDDGGLIISAQMKAATQQHLRQNDFIEDFIADNYVKVPNASVKAKDLLADLYREYPHETSRFKRSDLIQLVANVDGVTCVIDRTKTKVFKGIGKAADENFPGSPVSPDDDIPFE